MDRSEMVKKIIALIDDSKTAVLATVDDAGCPHMRWMTPTLIRRRQALYAFTSPRFAKVAQLSAHPDVQWLIQTRALTEIVSVRGKVNVLDNPALKAEIMEAVGRRLTVFWNVNAESTDVVVLETVIDETTYFRPMKGIRETVVFSHLTPEELAT